MKRPEFFCIGGGLLFLLVFSLFPGSASAAADKSHSPAAGLPEKTRTEDEPGRLFHAARRLFKEKKYENALLRAQEALRLSWASRIPWEVLEARQLAGECCLKLDRNGKALEHFSINETLLQALLDSPAGFLWNGRLHGLLAKNNLLAGNVHYNQQAYSSALSYYLRAAEHQKVLNAPAASAAILHRVAVNYFYLGNYDKSLEVASESLKQAQKASSPNDIAAASYILGYVYRDLKNTSLAMEYFQSSLDSARRSSDPYYFIMSLNEIGNVLSSQKKFKEARAYKERALQAAYASKDTYNISTCLNDLGVTCSDQGDYDQALRYFQESYKIDITSGLARETAITASNIASIYMMKNNSREALGILEEVLPAAEKAGLRKEMLTLYNSLLDVHLQLGNREESRQYQKKANDAREAMFTEEIAKQVADFQAKYQTEKKQRENDLLKNDLKIQTLAMSQQRNLRNFLVSLSGMIVLVAAILFNRYRFKTRANRLLEEANRQIRDRREELARANRRLEELSRKDPLTGLANRREMLERIEQEKTRFERTGRPFSLVMADIDDFKAYNDTHGHDCGDILLKSLATRLRGAIRRQDLVSRWGGDEFLFLLPETDLTGGRTASRKIQALVARSIFRYKDKHLRLRVSLGASVFKKGQHIDGCLKEADQFMFNRKRRNKAGRAPAARPRRPSG